MLLKKWIDTEDLQDHCPKDKKECNDCIQKQITIERFIESMNWLKLEQNFLQEEVSNCQNHR